MVENRAKTIAISESRTSSGDQATTANDGRMPASGTQIAIFPSNSGQKLMRQPEAPNANQVIITPLKGAKPYVIPRGVVTMYKPLETAKTTLGQNNAGTNQNQLSMQAKGTTLTVNSN